MGKFFSLPQTVATAGVFSALSFWYGFMLALGTESSHKELGQVIDDLWRQIPSPESTDS